MEPSVPRVINTDNFEVGIHNDNKTGWFYHHKYGDEFGGGLWFENNKLTDYDGISDFLPDEVIEAIVKCINPKPFETISDPSCGTGGFFLSSLEHLKQNKLNQILAINFIKKARKG